MGAVATRRKRAPWQVGDRDRPPPWQEKDRDRPPPWREGDRDRTPRHPKGRVVETRLKAQAERDREGDRERPGESRIRARGASSCPEGAEPTCAPRARPDHTEQKRAPHLLIKRNRGAGCAAARPRKKCHGAHGVIVHKPAEVHHACRARKSSTLRFTTSGTSSCQVTHTHERTHTHTHTHTHTQSYTHRSTSQSPQHLADAVHPGATSWVKKLPPPGS